MRAKMLIASTVFGAVLLGLAAGGASWLSRSGPQAGTPTTGAPQPSPSATPSPTVTFPSDEPTYPPFAGQAAALTAFGPVSADDPMDCTGLDPAGYQAQGAAEVYQCQWPDLPGFHLAISRWATGAQGAAAWQAAVPDAGVTAWGMGDSGPDLDRGPAFAWGTGPTHRVLCYRDFPYCGELVFDDDSVVDPALSRLGALTTDAAAQVVAAG